MCENVEKWNSAINKAVRDEGLSGGRNETERKESLTWYKEKEAPRYEKR